jgi:hypothetical protein
VVESGLTGITSQDDNDEELVAHNVAAEPSGSPGLSQAAVSVGGTCLVTKILLRQ